MILEVKQLSWLFSNKMGLAWFCVLLFVSVEHDIRRLVSQTLTLFDAAVGKLPTGIPPSVSCTQITSRQLFHHRSVVISVDINQQIDCCQHCRLWSGSISVIFAALLSTDWSALQTAIGKVHPASALLWLHVTSSVCLFIDLSCDFHSSASVAYWFILVLWQSCCLVYCEN